MQEHMRTVFSFTSSSALKISHHTLLCYVKQESIWVLGNAVKELGVVAWPRKNGSISLLVIKNCSQGSPGNYYHGRIHRVDDEMICVFVCTHAGVVRAYDEAWQLDKGNCHKYFHWTLYFQLNKSVVSWLYSTDKILRGLLLLFTWYITAKTSFNYRMVTLVADKLSKVMYC